MSSNGKINTKSSTAAVQGRVDSSTKQLASLNLQDPEAKASHLFDIYEDPICEATTQAKEDPTLAVEHNEVADKENARPAKPALPTHQNEGPAHAADDPASDVQPHTPFNSVGIHRLARNRPAPVRRPLAEMTDFEKEQEKKNAHFVKRLENARQQLQIRDKELDELEQFTLSFAMERRAQRDAARREYFEPKKALGVQPSSNDKDAPFAAPFATVVGSPLKTMTTASAQASSEKSGNKKKDVLHLRTSSGNKIAKSSSSGWTAINHRK